MNSLHHIKKKEQIVLLKWSFGPFCISLGIYLGFQKTALFIYVSSFIMDGRCFIALNIWRIRFQLLLFFYPFLIRNSVWT